MKKFTLNDLVRSPIVKRQSEKKDKRAAFNIIDSPVYDRFEGPQGIITQGSHKKEKKSDKQSDPCDLSLIDFSPAKNFSSINRKLLEVSPPVPMKRLNRPMFDNKENIPANVNKISDCKVEFEEEKKNFCARVFDFKRDFRVEGKLGEGAFSVVHKIKRYRDNKYFALKTYKTSNRWPTANGEARILESLDHQKIIKYYG